MTGGLRYQIGREMPLGMQALYGAKLADNIRVVDDPVTSGSDSACGPSGTPVPTGECEPEKLPLFDWPHKSSIDKIRQLYINGEFEEQPKMEPIITLLQAGWERALVGEVLKAVGEVGVYVNEERLLRALRDAESFWEEGCLAAIGSDRGWISVDKQYPDSKTKVMVFGGDKKIWFEGKLQSKPSQFTGYTRGRDEGWFRWDDDEYIPNVTHWRPMFADPEGVKI